VILASTSLIKSQTAKETQTPTQTDASMRAKMHLALPAIAIT